MTVLVYKAALELTEWMHQHEGRIPSRMFVSKPLFDAMCYEIKVLTYRDQPLSAPGIENILLMGVPLYPDTTIPLLGRIEEQD